MKRQELENRVVILQARVRGYLVRKKLSSLREEYENIVREIEGDLVLLEWCGETIQRPVFVNKKRALSQATSCTAAEEPTEDHSSAAHTNKTTCRTSEMLQPERDTDGATLFAVEQHPREERAVPELLCEGARHVLESVEASASVSELSGSAEEEERDLRSCTDLTSVWNSTTRDSGSSVIHKVYCSAQTLSAEHRARKCQSPKKACGCTEVTWLWSYCGCSRQSQVEKNIWP
ncbi:IQ domain-containing protein C-like isoform X3 [Acipenser ruthenus]|uniref:IQ domain-containing protein C-like isoform X3 n=1 Tax=Acipenser ruthenus TaxID=7906 RepID=UPI002740B84A|nr:IQ domain-containing protein C-like isoform X3 [Acipenser ruthenus]